MAFRAPDLKKAIKAALDMGLTVIGYEIGPEGQIRVQTQTQIVDSADAALDTWKRGKRG